MSSLQTQLFLRLQLQVGVVQRTQLTVTLSAAKHQANHQTVSDHYTQLIGGYIITLSSLVGISLHSAYWWVYHHTQLIGGYIITLSLLVGISLHSAYWWVYHYTQLIGGYIISLWVAFLIRSFYLI